MSSSSHIDNKKKDILIFGKYPTQGLEHRVTAEKMYSIKFTKKNTKFCLSLHYNGRNSYSFVNGKKVHKFTAKDFEIDLYELCLENISKGWSVDNIKKTGLKGCVYDFSIDYDAIKVSDILDIHKFRFVKRVFVSTMIFFGCNLSNINPLECVLMNNQECKVR